MPTPDVSKYPILSFPTQKDWHDWLVQNHDSVDGIWLHMFKKDSEIKSINYALALDEALCFGWIDGQGKKYDETSWLQKFTPRRAKSIWSKRNTLYVERLTKEGRMQPAGQIEIDKAKADGRWNAAYESQKNMVMPEDFLKELDKFPEAKSFYEKLSNTNKFSIFFRLTSAKKSETRQKRFDQLLEMLKKGEKFH
ncbi:MAG: YdeI/OmpD-associated family protein [Candidatus Gracilibacteria bacterium]